MRSAVAPLVWLAVVAGALCPLAGASLGDSVQPLYSATESFLDLVQPADKSFLLRDFVPRLMNGTILHYWRGADISQVSREYAMGMLGYSILVCLGLALIVLVPLCGCCVCCCRCCCGKCGGKLSYMERKGARCRRGVCGLLLLAFVTFVLFGAVLALVSNQLLREQFPPPRPAGDGPGALTALSEAFAKTVDSIAALPQRGRNATPRAVDETVRRVLPRLNRTLASLQDRLLNATDAAGALDAAGAVLDTLATAQEAARASAAGHGILQNSVTSLNVTLKELRDAFQNGTPPCPSGANQADCDFVNRTLEVLVFSQEMPGLAQLVSARDAIARHNATGTRARFEHAAAAMKNISAAGMELVTKYISDHQNALNGSELMRVWDQLDDTLQPALRQSNAYRNLSLLRVVLTSPVSVGELTSTIDSYRYYAYIGLGSFVLLLVALFYLGLVYGCAGEPPYEDAGCCNRGVGANCLLAGAGLAWLFYALVMLVVMLLFLAGGLAHTEVCRYLRNRPGSNGYALLDDLATQALRRYSGPLAGNSTQLNLTRPVSTLLGGCAPDNSLAGLLDVEQYVRSLGLPASIDRFLDSAKAELVRQAGSFVPQGGFDAAELRQLVGQVANASGAFNASDYEAKIKVLLKSDAMSTLQTTLQRISLSARNDIDKARFQGYYTKLYQADLSVASLLTNQSATVTQLSTILNTLTSGLRDLPERVAGVGAALRNATLLRAAFDAATVGLPDDLLTEATAALVRLQADLVDCAGLGRQLRQLIDVPCVRLLQPFNGFWAGLGICLLGLLPCMVLAIKLANLYRKAQKYLPDIDDRNPKPV